MEWLHRLKKRLWPDRDPQVLYVSVDELPNPRDWGQVECAIGNKTIFCEAMKLDESAANFVEALMGQHWKEINDSGYKRIEFSNVADWARDRIVQKLQP
jgi:hypothetical protein